jgi:hypothetical protein
MSSGLTIVHAGKVESITGRIIMKKNNICGISAGVATLLGSLSFTAPAMSAEVFLPIEVGVPYQVEFGGKGQADLQYPIGIQCITINDVKRCNSIMGGREIVTRGKTNAVVVFNQDQTFEVNVQEKSKSGRIITPGGVLNGTYSQDPKNNKLKLKLDKDAKQIDQLGIYPNLSEIQNYVRYRPSTFGNFYSVSSQMGGKLKEGQGGENTLILQLNQSFRSTRGYTINMQHALCPNQCQALRNALN